MEQTPATQPEAGHVCPDPITQVVGIAELAERLGVQPGTIRQHINAGTGLGWLPRPAGRINGGHVWRRTDVDAINLEDRPPGRPTRLQVEARQAGES
ncbi:MAG: hypothetical protein HGA44_09545 [Cellulomonadaceae bacterium]|nr:hypothetical protein [Cellulomonadaceae bacterium]